MSSKKYSTLKYDITKELEGKKINDKRGGANNIHSWDIELKGTITKQQQKILNVLLLERRKKKWAIEKNIDWMDGIPLTLNDIKTFFDCRNLEFLLNDLVKKRIFKLWIPKEKNNKIK